MSIILDRAKRGLFSLIAEIGVNYYDIAAQEQISNMDAAQLMIRKAKEAGIHAVKFQSYKAETLAAKASPSYWNRSEEPTASQYELFRKFDSFGVDEYQKLKEYSDSVGIEFLSTAFDLQSADFLEPLMEIYKISSSDLNNLPFVEYQARKNKPILLSTGASDLEEIERTLSLIRKWNNQPVCLMHCVLEYPTPYEDANLNKITALREHFPDVFIGYSDHTKPDECADVIKTAYNLGALIVEKHFTLDKKLKGNDHYHAMDTKDAVQILKGIEFIDKIRGSSELKCLETEKVARANARRSLVSRCKIARGVVLSEEMLTAKRPGTGIKPEQMSEVIGKRSKLEIAEDTILDWNMIE